MAACEIDNANEMQEVMLAASLANRVVYAGVSEEFCDSCGAEIPEARRLAVPGCKLCVHCQSVAERR